MKRPFAGTPVSFSDYFNGKLKDHLVGILGGVIWCIGMSLSIIASGKAGPASFLWIRPGCNGCGSTLGYLCVEGI